METGAGLFEAQWLEMATNHQRGKRRPLAAGEWLIEEGEVAGGVFVLVDGALDVSRRVDGEAVSVALIDRPGTVIGEIVALAGGTRTATVTAVEPSEIVELTAAEFGEILAERPEFGRHLSALALQRAEEAELIELLAGHFGVRDEDTLARLRSAAAWRYLGAGEVLFRQGEPSDTIQFVLRGRLRAERLEPDGRQEVIGTIGRGEVVGELGLLQGTPRSATVTALRDTVVAVVGQDAFFELIERHPRTMAQLGLKALTRAAQPPGEARPRILALLISPQLNYAYVTGLVVGELEKWGSVAIFSPELVDSALGAPGASQARPGEVGDVPLAKLLHEAELENEHVVLALANEPGPWAERCLSLADRLVVVLPADPSAAEIAFVHRFVGYAPRFVPPVLVLAHPPEATRPAGSARVAETIGAVDVFHVRQGSGEDVSRVARVIAGRGNALVLSGGGGRGFAHIGVLRALNELGVPIDIYGGTSIGGILSLIMADAVEPDELVRWAGSHFASVLDYTLPLVALVKGGRISRAARETFGERDLEDLWRTAFAVSADLTTSRLHVHRRGPIDVTVRATSAIPGVMPPVPVGESLLVDGGVLNNLPVDVARQMTSAGLVIASDVAPPSGPRARTDYGLSISGWEALVARFRSGRSPLPGISSVMLRSMIIASMRQREAHLSAELVDCYLDLDVRGIGMLDFDDPAGVARRGYEAAMPVLEEWLERRSSGRN